MLLVCTALAGCKPEAVDTAANHRSNGSLREYATDSTILDANDSIVNAKLEMVRKATLDLCQDSDVASRITDWMITHHSQDTGFGFTISYYDLHDILSQNSINLWVKCKASFLHNGGSNSDTTELYNMLFDGFEIVSGANSLALKPILFVPYFNSLWYTECSDFESLRETSRLSIMRPNIPAYEPTSISSWTFNGTSWAANNYSADTTSDGIFLTRYQWHISLDLPEPSPLGPFTACGCVWKPDGTTGVYECQVTGNGNGTCGGGIALFGCNSGCADRGAELTCGY